MKEISLKGKRGEGQCIILDDADYAELSQFNWYLSNGYAITRYRADDGSFVMITAHRMLMRPSDKSVQVDHENGNRLDNRRSNLRLCTAAQNHANSKPYGKYGYKGIQQRYDGTWEARIRTKGKGRIIGVFATPEAAAIAYDYAAFRLYGDFAKLNF